MTLASEEELAAAIRAADGPLTIRGGGTRAPQGKPGSVLSVSGLTGITLYEPGTLTMVAKAGTPMSEIEAALAAEGQRLAFEPWDARRVLGRDGEPTLGGCVATNASGPRRIVANACRDAVLGLRFVDGEGTVLKSGGRVMKNVTGLDLVRLLCGSRGTLGAITEVCLKLLPGVAATATLSAEGMPVERAVAAMSAALGTPFEVSGAAHDPQAGQTHLRLEGSETSVAYRSDRLKDALARHGTWAVTEGEGPWPRLRDAADLAGGADLWRISVRPSRAPEVAGVLPGRFFLDWGGGLIWAEAPAGTDLRTSLRHVGHATLVRAAPSTHARLGTFHPETDAVARLTGGLRARFDPRGLFRPRPVPA